MQTNVQRGTSEGAESMECQNLGKRGARGRVGTLINKSGQVESVSPLWGETGG